MKAWADRPLEQRALLNPAFLAVVVAEAAAGYEDESAAPLPFALAFLAVPISLHEPTREALPTIATSMPAWLLDYPQARVHIPPLALQLVPHTREAIRFGVRRGALGLSLGGAVRARKLSKAARGSQTADVRRCRSRAHFAGRWCARAGDPATVLSLWGLSA